MKRVPIKTALCVIVLLDRPFAVSAAIDPRGHEQVLAPMIRHGVAP